MKNKLYFLLFTAMATLISCSENEQPPEEEPSLIVGEWYIEEINIQGTKTETQDGQSVTYDYRGNTGSDENSKIIYNDDNTYTREDSYSLMIHTMVGSASHSFDLTVFPHYISEGTYQIQGSKINFTSIPSNNIYGPLDPRNSFEWTIMELTANKLVISREEQESSNVDGAQIENEYEMTQIFSR